MIRQQRGRIKGDGESRRTAGAVIVEKYWRKRCKAATGERRVLWRVGTNEPVEMRSIRHTGRARVTNRY